MYALTPFERNTFDLLDAFNNFDKEFFGRHSAPRFRTDLRDEGDKYVMEAELPGFDKQDITLDITGDTLCLTAQHKEEKKEENKDKYVYRERSYGSYRRSFDISGVDAQGIEAQYRNGILYLDLPKKETRQPETKRLEIK